MSAGSLVAVVMAGGAGTRFWPMSTHERPKQLLELFGDRTLLQHSWDRVVGLIPPERVLVLTSEHLLAAVRAQLPGLPEANAIGEPCPRDTAGAVALAAHICRQRFPGSVMAVVTADHDIRPRERFHHALEAAAWGARQSGALYTFGVAPDRPATEYGYLECGAAVEVHDDVEHLELVRFKEKPDLETARGFLESERFLWNSGMFVWTVEAIWEALETHLPEHARALATVPVGPDGGVTQAALRAALEPLPRVSIDFGLMEKHHALRCLRAEFTWNDLGSWRALEREYPPGPAGNRARGRLHSLDAEGCFVFCEDADEEVALLGVHDLVVIRSQGRTLVAPRSRLGELRRLVTERILQDPADP